MTPDTAGGWTLHPQLEHDTHPAGDLPLCRVLAINDANYPWLLLVPRRPSIVEIIDLPDAEQTQLMGEIALASRVMKSITGCDKINVAALGNVVPQLHVHVIARSRSDPAWPKPVWGTAPPKDYSHAAQEQFLGLLRQEMQLAPV